MFTLFNVIFWSIIGLTTIGVLWGLYVHHCYGGWRAYFGLDDPCPHCGDDNVVFHHSTDEAYCPECDAVWMTI